MPYEFCNKIILGLGRVIGSCAKKITARALSLESSSLTHHHKPCVGSSLLDSATHPSCVPPTHHFFYSSLVHLFLHMPQRPEFSTHSLSLSALQFKFLSFTLPLGSPIPLFIIPLSVTDLLFLYPYLIPELTFLEGQLH